jgi:hypothetical protein
MDRSLVIMYVDVVEDVPRDSNIGLLQVLTCRLQANILSSYIGCDSQLEYASPLQWFDRRA